ncbi:MAG: sugar nucleotide-binding protein [Pseudomonadota bacterium]
MARILIIGADGAIGQALEKHLQARGDDVIGTSRREHHERARFSLDLAAPDISNVQLPTCDVAIVCAAMARFADCRDNPELARAVNVTGPQIIGHKVVTQGGRVIYLSSSVALPCDRPQAPANQPRDPHSAYGRYKADGETAILRLGNGASIFRLTKVIQPDMPLFKGWIEALSNGRPISAFSDLTFSPITLHDVLNGITVTMNDGGGGIYQVSGAADPSYVDAARHLARSFGRSDAMVNPVLASENGIDARDIVRFTSLDTSRITDLSGWHPPHYGAVLDRVFAKQQHAAS